MKHKKRAATHFHECSSPLALYSLYSADMGSMLHRGLSSFYFSLQSVHFFIICLNLQEKVIYSSFDMISMVIYVSESAPYNNIEVMWDG